MQKICNKPNRTITTGGNKYSAKCMEHRLNNRGYKVEEKKCLETVVSPMLCRWLTGRDGVNHQ